MIGHNKLINPKKLHIFSVVAELRNITHAAQKLNLSQPAISNSLLSLEQFFDMKLYEIVGKETFKEKMIRLSGEINDEDYDFSDAYYGITLFGWSLLKENVTTNYAELIELGIMYCA